MQNVNTFNQSIKTHLCSIEYLSHYRMKYSMRMRVYCYLLTAKNDIKTLANASRRMLFSMFSNCQQVGCSATVLYARSVLLLSVGRAGEVLVIHGRLRDSG